MSRIQKTFSRLQGERRTALIPYITAGDPRPAITVELMHALVKGGADIIELGVPFSDPMADGPVIQRAAERALAHGTSLRQVLAMVADFRTHDQSTPVVLMGYANPVEAMGYQTFSKLAQDAGVDGVLTVDLPPEEAVERVSMLKEHSIDPIFLLAPTTPVKRMQAVAELASGYVYYVSLKGVTGAANLDVEDVSKHLATLRQHIKLPIGVGFGIRDATSATAIADVADGVVIGSRVVSEVEKGESGLTDRLTEFLTGIRSAMDHSK